jgi:hypothetical protein
LQSKQSWMEYTLSLGGIFISDLSSSGIPVRLVLQ